ncbi:MAG: hypothetical protein GW898_10790 [Thiomicrospira sp.]|nr:hypothetical protein [Thiomicrospira sp.]NCN67725.1 hypothetical protein [Thiomicrospira sp.]NCO14844.1 hypothetical protein [Thiomicrospira sp.]NCO80539.1 hypothetical protein [Thiomicrospira sp.]OIP96491.1 MAG: hypothetical protein AUK56_01930 [Thiomicrospira sp. CG2_30_44_34]
MYHIIVISSQAYLNESIVEDKISKGVDGIYLSPPFVHKGIVKAVLLDGHHTLEACKRQNIKPQHHFIDDDLVDGLELLFSDEIEWYLDWAKGEVETEWYPTYRLYENIDPINL